VNNAVASDSIIASHIKHFNDLDFTVVAEAHDYRVEFKIYDIVGFEEGETKGIYDRPVWQRAGAHVSPDIVDTLNNAEVYLSGHVKWDGCSNWRFDEQDRCMLHGCGKADIQRFGAIMAACWDWAAELCPNWMD
jgi:hypothetical protein